jgi:NADPH:quinone reductase-like Zn-dependent oxidoreductase
LSDGDVLVRVDAAALNPVGYKLMEYMPSLIARRPFAAENDFAGVVVASKSAKHAVGERVFGMVPMPSQGRLKQGALAEYVRLPGVHVVRLPDNISMVDGAGITLAGETAYQGLFKHGGVQEGQTVFINGGSTSVGAFAIQMAKIKGCTVWASASGKNEKFVRELGADVFIDYTKAPLHETLLKDPPKTKFHFIFETVGLVDQSLYTHSEKYLAPNGIFLSTLPSPNNLYPSELFKMALMVWQLRPRLLGGVNRSWRVFLLDHNEQDLTQIAQWLAEGKMKPIVDSVFEFKDVMLAYDRLKSKRATGKVVIKVNPDV